MQNAIVGVIVALVVVVSTVWVYYDATKHKVGKKAGGKGFTNMSAGAWGIATLLIWIIAFPTYLICRSTLIEQANENPVEVKGRSAKIAAFAVIGAVIVVVEILSFAQSTAAALPGCGDPQTISLAQQIYNGAPAVKAAGTQFVQMKNISEEGYNAAQGLRTCNATLISTAGDEQVVYSVTWQDSSHKNFYVTLRDASSDGDDNN